MQTVAVTSVQLDCFSNTKLTGSDLTWEHLLERRTDMAARGCDAQRRTLVLTQAKPPTPLPPSAHPRTRTDGVDT